MLEKHVVAQICAFLRSLGILHWAQPQAGYFDAKRKRFRKHVSPGVMNGTPDIIAIIAPGSIFLGIEVKTPVGRLSPYQKEFQKKCMQYGAHYIVARSVEDVKKALRDIKTT